MYSAGAPAYGQTALSVLGEAPEHVAQRQQRIQVEARQGVVPGTDLVVLEAGEDVVFIVCTRPPSSCQ